MLVNRVFHNLCTIQKRQFRSNAGILPLLEHARGEATGCYAGRHEVSRCRTRGESQEIYIMYAFAKCE